MVVPRSDHVYIRQLLTWLLLMASGCSAANILAIFADPAKSHVLAYQPLTKALAARGHNVTVISSHPQTKPLENYTDIYVPLKWFGVDDNIKTKLNPENDAELNNKPMPADHPFNIFYDWCRYFLETPAVQQLIHSSSPGYDLVIIELYLYECFLGFAHKYNCNVVGIYVHGGVPEHYEIVGNVHPISYVPHMKFLHTDRMGYMERVRNAHIIFLERLRKLNDMKMYDTITQTYFAEFLPPATSELLKRFVLIFFNNDLSLNLPKPLLPNVIDIAGMHIQPPQKLNQELQEFLDGSEHGVVLFTMGSHIGDFLQSEEKTHVFLDAFSELKQKVLWKCSPLPGLPPNVKVMDWLPQADVLGHPKVLLYLTHGGLLGIEEAIYNAKPIVGIPINGDQFFNVKRAQAIGYGIYLDYGNLTKERLLWALNTVILDPSYTNTARIVSARFRDHPVPPIEKAVFWTEYVIKHPQDRRFHAAVRELHWYQEWLLDVVAFLVLLGICGVYLLYQFLKLVFNILNAEDTPNELYRRDAPRGGNDDKKLKQS